MNDAMLKTRLDCVFCTPGRLCRSHSAEWTPAVTCLICKKTPPIPPIFPSLTPGSESRKARLFQRKTKGNCVRKWNTDQPGEPTQLVSPSPISFPIMKWAILTATQIASFEGEKNIMSYSPLIAIFKFISWNMKSEIDRSSLILLRVSRRFSIIDWGVIGRDVD